MHQKLRQPDSARSPRKTAPRLLMLFVTLLCVSFQGKTYAQTTVHQDWLVMIETKNELEVLYSVVTCDGQKKVLLKYFNEMPVQQHIDYEVTVKYQGYVVTQKISRDVKPNEFSAATCSESRNDLVINLPQSWNLESGISVSAEVK